MLPCLMILPTLPYDTLTCDTPTLPYDTLPYDTPTLTYDTLPYDTLTLPYDSLLYDTPTLHYDTRPMPYTKPIYSLLVSVLGNFFLYSSYAALVTALYFFVTLFTLS